MRDPECEAIGHRLSRFLDGELPAEERGRVEKHLIGCADCRAALEIWSRIGVASVDLLRRAIPDSPLRLKPEPSDDRAAAPLLPRKTRRRLVRKGLPTHAGALLAAAGLLVGLSVLLAVPALRGRRPPEVPSRPPEEVRLAEQELEAKEEARIRAEEEMARWEEERRRLLEERKRIDRAEGKPVEEQRVREALTKEQAEAEIRRVIDEVEARHREAAERLARAEADRRRAEENLIRTRGSPTTLAVAALAETGEGTFILSGGERSPARAGQALLAGQGLESAGRAVVAYPDSTRLELGPETVVRQIDDRAGKRVFLQRGVLKADVVPQPPGRPLVLETPQAEARVLGTRIVLSAGADETRLEVLEGKVRFTRLADRKAVDVVSGHVAVAAAGVELVSRPLPRVLFADTFEGSPLNRWPEGWHRHPTEAATRSGFVVLQEKGNRFLGCPNPSSSVTQHALIPLETRGFELWFRLRLSGPEVTRAGVEIEDGRIDLSFEYDHTEGVVRADWPRGKVLQQVPYRLLPGRWTEWRVSVQERRFSVSIEGRPLLLLDLAEFTTPKRVSLVSKGKDSAQFDDVKILSLPDTGRR